MRSREFLSYRVATWGSMANVVKQVPFAEVETRWIAAGGKDTRGILKAFEDLVERWSEEHVTAGQVAEFRYIGGIPTEKWAVITGGTYRIGDSVGNARAFEWQANWSLITVRDPGNGQRVILDGNNRAERLELGRGAGSVHGDTKIAVITGELVQPIRFIAKAMAPLWHL